jgi:hypothetical protein
MAMAIERKRMNEENRKRGNVEKIMRKAGREEFMKRVFKASPEFLYSCLPHKIFCVLRVSLQLFF